MTEATTAAIAGAIASPAGGAGTTVWAVLMPPVIALLFGGFCYVLVRRDTAEIDRKIAESKRARS